jgi:hypothetical protein
MLQDTPLIQIDNDFLRINNVPVCKVLPGNVLEFQDHNRRKYRATRGPLRVGLLELVRVIAEQANQ